jgi:hypothetical protein
LKIGKEQRHFHEALIRKQCAWCDVVRPLVYLCKTNTQLLVWVTALPQLARLATTTENDWKEATETPEVIVQLMDIIWSVHG